MRATFAALTGFVATLALVGGIMLAVGDGTTAVGQVGECPAGYHFVLAPINGSRDIDAVVSGPAGSSLVAVNDGGSPSTGVLTANAVVLGAAPAGPNDQKTYDLPGDGPWTISGTQGRVSVCVTLTPPTPTTTQPPDTTSTTTTTIPTTTTTLPPVTSSSVPSTTAPPPPTTSTVPPTTATTSVPPTTTTPPTTTEPPGPTPAVTLECLTVGWLINTTGNVGELVISVDGEPVTGTQQDEGLFVSGFDGQTIVVASGAGTHVDTHNCGRESG